MRRRRRRRVVWKRFAPLLLMAGLAFATGAAIGAGNEDPRRTTAQRFVAAWARSDYAAMHAMLTPEARDAIGVRRFAAAYRNAADLYLPARDRTFPQCCLCHLTPKSTPG